MDETDCAADAATRRIITGPLRKNPFISLSRAFVMP